MAAPNVDLVFVVDASGSMGPCFEALRTHLEKVLQPLQGYVSEVRFGLVAQAVSRTDGGALYAHYFVGDEGLEKLYEPGPNGQDHRNDFFTTDPRKLMAKLASIKPMANEEMLVALDIAADFPFGPLANTKRVIALFSDEPFESGISQGAYNEKIPEISKKLMDRHIQLFMAVPEGDASHQLSQVDRSEVEFIDGGDGLRSVDFKQLLGQMGKSISASSIQAVAEPPYQRAIFGQDKWGYGDGAWSDSDA